jgi:hypothetical protein
VQAREDKMQWALEQISKIKGVTPRKKAEALYKIRKELANFIQSELDSYTARYLSKVVVAKFTNKISELRAQAKKDFEPFLTPQEKYLLQQFNTSL